MQARRLAVALTSPYGFPHLTPATTRAVFPAWYVVPRAEGQAQTGEQRQASSTACARSMRGFATRGAGTERKGQRRRRWAACEPEVFESLPPAAQEANYRARKATEARRRELFDQALSKFKKNDIEGVRPQ